VTIPARLPGPARPLPRSCRAEGVRVTRLNLLCPGAETPRSAPGPRAARRRGRTGRSRASSLTPHHSPTANPARRSVSRRRAAGGSPMCSTIGRGRPSSSQRSIPARARRLSKPSPRSAADRADCAGSEAREPGREVLVQRSSSPGCGKRSTRIRRSCWRLRQSARTSMRRRSPVGGSCTRAASARRPARMYRPCVAERDRRRRRARRPRAFLRSARAVGDRGLARGSAQGGEDGACSGAIGRPSARRSSSSAETSAERSRATSQAPVHAGLPDVVGEARGAVAGRGLRERAQDWHTDTRSSGSERGMSIAGEVRDSKRPARASISRAFQRTGRISSAGLEPSAPSPRRAPLDLRRGAASHSGAFGGRPQLALDEARWTGAIASTPASSALGPLLRSRTESRWSFVAGYCDRARPSEATSAQNRASFASSAMRTISNVLVVDAAERARRLPAQLEPGARGARDPLAEGSRTKASSAAAAFRSRGASDRRGRGDESLAAGACRPQEREERALRRDGSRIVERAGREVRVASVRGLAEREDRGAALEAPAPSGRRARSLRALLGRPWDPRVIQAAARRRPTPAGLSSARARRRDGERSDERDAARRACKPVHPRQRRRPPRARPPSPRLDPRAGRRRGRRPVRAAGRAGERRERPRVSASTRARLVWAGGSASGSCGAASPARRQ
jgi:hypothetical protein